MKNDVLFKPVANKADMGYRRFFVQAKITRIGASPLIQQNQSSIGLARHKMPDSLTGW
jgi:hypothetical protein